MKWKSAVHILAQSEIENRGERWYERKLKLKPKEKRRKKKLTIFHNKMGFTKGIKCIKGSLISFNIMQQQVRHSHSYLS